MASAQLFEAVPIYNGLTLEQLGGRGVRWPAREQAAALPGAGELPAPPKPRKPQKARGRQLVAGSYRSLWAAPEVAASPALAFLHPHQRVEISPADAQRLELRDGDEMLVSDEHGGEVRARVALRERVPAGRAFLARALPRDGAENLRGDLVEIVAIPEPPPAEPEPEPDPAEALA